jgi:putative phosphoesterase
MIAGIISDTHGLLRPEALAALRGSDIIIHAGDIGAANILEQLREIAPTVAVRGNNDTQPWAARLPESEIVRFGGHVFLLLHDIAHVGEAAQDTKLAGVIFGHSHRALIEQREGLLYLNPGSAGPRRFNLPVSVATMRVSDGAIEPKIVPLAVGKD